MAKRSGPERRQWRPAVAAPRQSLVVANWRRGEATHGASNRRRWLGRPLRIVLGAVGAVVCFATTIVVALWIQPVDPVGLYVVEAGYLTNLAVPPNAEGLHTVDALRRLVPSGSAGGWLRPWVGGLVNPTQIPLDDKPWDNRLKSLPEATVIIAMTAQAGADSAGPFLVRDLPDLLVEPAEAGRSPDATRLYLRDVVRTLRQPPHQKKRFLLVLDVARPLALPALGMLHNDFNASLMSLNSELTGGNVLIVAPGAPVGANPPADSTGPSAFGQAVVDGLRGRGNPIGGRVDSTHLVAYLEARLHDRPIVLGEEAGPIPLTLAAPSADRTRPVDLPPAPEGLGSRSNPTVPSPESSWVLARRLAESNPESYAPLHWRRYRETLLRNEALGRSLGLATTTAGQSVRKARTTLQERLELLKQQIDAAQVIPLPRSSSLGLAWPLAGGTVPLALSAVPSDPEAADAKLVPALRRRFDATWSGGPDTANPVTSDRERPIGYDLLLEALKAGLQTDELTRVGRMLGHLKNGTDPRPFEAHALAILTQKGSCSPALLDSTARVGQDLIGLSLQVRRQAGRSHIGAAAASSLALGTYPHAEQIAPLVIAANDEGDRYRRQAEDALFLSDPAEWKAAIDDLEIARKAYGEAEAQATELRRTVVVRDRAFADLPFLADWVTNHPEPESVRPLIEPLETAWDSAHRLVSLLRPGYNPDQVHRARLTLESAQKSVRNAFDLEVERLRVAPDQVTNPVASTKVPATIAAAEVGSEALALSDQDRRALGSRREALLGLLNTPFPTDRDRQILGQRLTEQVTSERSRLASAPQPAPSGGERRKRALDDLEQVHRATRTGRLALARLGSEVVDGINSPRTPTRSAERFVDLRNGLTTIGRATRTDAATVGELGLWAEQIGWAQRRIPLLIEQQVDRGLPRAVPDWPVELQAADQLGRILEAAQELVPNPKRPKTSALAEPTATFRHRLVQKLLLTEAGRTLDDHWFGENDDPNRADEPDAVPPYYWAVIDRLMKDLRGLDPAIPAPGLPEAMVGQGAGVRPAERLAVVGPKADLLPTDEPKLAPRYLIQRPVGPETGATERGWDGRVAVQLDLPPSAAGVRVGARGDWAATRQAWKIRSPAPWKLGELGPEEGQILDDLSFALPRNDDTDSPPQLRHVKGSFVVAGHYRGQLIQQPSPFVLHPVPEIIVEHVAPPPTGTVTVLADRDLVAQFGQAEEGELVIVLDCSGSMGANQNPPLKYREATDGVRRILERVARGTRVSIWAFGQAIGPGKTRLDAENTIQPIRTPITWEPSDPRLLNDVMSRIEFPQLQPWNDSPIVEAMIRASRDFHDEARGPKSLVVLTDGKDDRFEKYGGPKGGPGDITAALAGAFAGRGIEISLVGFRVEGDEGEMRNQFRSVKLLNPPGRIVSVQQADQFTDAIRSTLRCEAWTLTNVPVGATFEVSDRFATSPAFTRLDPGFYKLAVKAGRWFDRPLAIHPGDHLTVQLKQGDGQIQMTQVTRLDRLRLPVPARMPNDWLLAVRCNQLQPGTVASLKLQAALERRADPRAMALEEIRPQFAWMELRAGGGQAEFQQIWRQVDGDSAPTWQVDVPAWPTGPEPSTPAEPILEAYWSLRGRERPYEIRLPALGALVDINHDGLLSVETHRGRVWLRSLTLEEMPEASITSAKRLVVRLGHLPNLRIMARPIGLPASPTEEHRLFTQAGRTTATFGPFDANQIRDALTGIEVIAIDEGIDQARSERNAVDDLHAGPPTSGACGPDRLQDPTPDAPIDPLPNLGPRR